MLSYFDKLFVRVYYWYIAHKEKDIPALYGLLVISLFQIFNVFSTVFFIGGLLYGRNWSCSKLEITFVGLGILAFDYIRIYKIIGFDKLIEKYSTAESRKVFVPPVIYFIASVLIVIILRIIGLYPDII